MQLPASSRMRVSKRTMAQFRGPDAHGTLLLRPAVAVTCIGLGLVFLAMDWWWSLGPPMSGLARLATIGVILVAWGLGSEWIQGGIGA